MIKMYPYRTQRPSSRQRTSIGEPVHLRSITSNSTDHSIGCGMMEVAASQSGRTKARSFPRSHFSSGIKRSFWDALHEPNQSLLSIGYSFRDPHINETILNAVKNAGLTLFVMSPETPEAFRDSVCETRRSARKNQLGSEGQGDEIWKALYGYYCGSIEHYYTSNHVKLPLKGQALFRDLGLV